MTNEQLQVNDKDEALLAIAKKRAAFKKSFLAYAIIIIFYGAFGFLMTEILETVIIVGHGHFGLL